MDDAADPISPPETADAPQVQAQILRSQAAALSPRERQKLLTSIDAALAKLDEKTIEPLAEN